MQNNKNDWGRRKPIGGSYNSSTFLYTRPQTDASQSTAINSRSQRGRREYERVRNRSLSLQPQTVESGRVRPRSIVGNQCVCLDWGGSHLGPLVVSTSCYVFKKQSAVDSTHTMHRAYPSFSLSSRGPCVLVVVSRLQAGR